MKAALATTVIFIALVLSSCAPSIVGEWQLSDVDIGMEVPADQQEMFDAMLQEMKDNTTYTFTDDGKITMKMSAMGLETVQDGTYTFKKDVLTVTMDGETSDLDVDLTKDSLKFNESDGDVTMSMTFERK